MLAAQPRLAAPYSRTGLLFTGSLGVELNSRGTAIMIRKIGCEKWVLALVSAALAAALPARATTLVDYTAGTSPSTGWFGLAFTTPSGGPWDDITFNFLATNATTPVAAGTAYIFSSAYAGTPSGLSSASYLAASTGVASNVYDFSATFTLQPGTTYYIFENTSITVGANGAGAGSYAALSSTTEYGVFSFVSLDFQVAGDLAPVPEPSAFFLAGLGAVALTMVRRFAAKPGEGTMSLERSEPREDHT
jgi:hypothetical protein